MQSDPICSSAGCTQYKHKQKGLGYKINYPVPNFGRDHDINDNFASLKLAEGMIGHQFQIGTAASKEKWANKAKDTDYDFNPALDGDVIGTLSNLNLAEGQLGHKWVIDAWAPVYTYELNTDVEVPLDKFRLTIVPTAVGYNSFVWNYNYLSLMIQLKGW